MKNIEYKTPGGSSRVLFDFDWRNTDELLPEEGVIIITDENVYRLYGEHFPDFPVIAIRPGEESKNLDTIGELTGMLLDSGIDRSGFILGIGGGVVCDIAGFLASVYMRGVRSGFVSTTLLSQVDASTGGKNGVNLGNYKNIVGTFSQPEFVVCDAKMLTTLSGDEYRSGLAELVKTALIGDGSFTEEIIAAIDELGSRKCSKLEQYIMRAVEIKASVVEEDEKESGKRRILNFGHTFGHAAELEYGIKHGMAVAWGMKAALEFSVLKGLLTPEEKERLSVIIDKPGLLPEVQIEGKRIAEKVGYDKKRSGDAIRFVFLSGAGKPVVQEVPIDELIDFITNYS